MVHSRTSYSNATASSVVFLEPNLGSDLGRKDLQVIAVANLLAGVDVNAASTTPASLERRERAIAIWHGSTGNGRNPMFNGRRQPSRGGTSRMTRECQVRFCEGLGVKFPGPTRHSR